MSDLFQSWRETLPQSASIAAVSRTGEELLTRWGEPHRHYHTIDHLAAVLLLVDDHSDIAQDVTAVRLAAWFHDAIYDPHRLDNEEASALWAERALPELDVPRARVAEIARLIRLTASHDPLPGDRNGELLTDADLAILAAPEPTYDAYARGVRREYAYLPDQVFGAGRSAVLSNLLALPRLFHTPVLRDRWERPARDNLARELSGFASTLPG